MSEKRLTIDAANAGQRVDKLVVAALPGLGRGGARRLFDDGLVRLNGRRARKGDVAKEGDELTVAAPDVGDGSATPEPDAPLDVRLETAEVVVVEKPAGQPTAPLAPGETGTLANALVARYPEMAGIGHAAREPGLLHRLDTETSGLLVAARTAAAFDTLAAALREGRLEKAYLLVCAAEGLGEAGTIEIPLAPHPKDRRRVYPCVHPRDVARYAPRPASTSFTLVRVAGPWALVEARAPKAARHQIRAHFAAIGHPLAGDALYGGAPADGLARHALHASYVAWAGDAAVPAFVVRSELPPDLAALVAG